MQFCTNANNKLCAQCTRSPRKQKTNVIYIDMYKQNRRAQKANFHPDTGFTSRGTITTPEVLEADRRVGPPTKTPPLFRRQIAYELFIKAAGGPNYLIHKPTELKPI